MATAMVVECSESEVNFKPVSKEDQMKERARELTKMSKQFSDFTSLESKVKQQAAQIERVKSHLAFLIASQKEAQALLNDSSKLEKIALKLLKLRVSETAILSELRVRMQELFDNVLKRDDK